MRALTRATDTLRSGHLLFSAELASGKVGEAQLVDPRVTAAVAPKPFASRATGALQRVAMKLGALDYERRCLFPMADARRAVLGDAASAPPRLLVRVDEFPLAGSYSAGRRPTEEFQRFHAVMRSAGVPYLLAVTPHVSDDYLDPRGRRKRTLDEGEAEALSTVARDGVAMALHGYDHRTRHRSPQRRSELSGLEPAELCELLDRGLAAANDLGFDPSVFVPPFNRFDKRQYASLAQRFQIVCGGPESVRLVGFHRTPQWRGGAVYLPAYPPVYGRASGILPVISRLLAAQPGTWVPLVIHWGWEAEDAFTALEALAQKIAPIAASWDEFLQSMAEARAADAGATA